VVRHTLEVALRVLTAEGPAAVRDRALDRVEEWRRRRAFRSGRDDSPLEAAVLNVLSSPLARRLGGLQIQFLHRLELEAQERAYALLHPEANGYRLERRHGRRRRAQALPGPAVVSPASLEDGAFETAVRRAAEVSGAKAVHVEGLAGVPPGSLLRIARSGWPLILSLHDFALFCPRPDLLERPAQKFCGYCVDLERCRACLGQQWDVAADFQLRYREAGAELLKSATVVIHPSNYLRSKFFELVPGLDRAVHRVIELGSPVSPPRAPDTGSRPVRHVAFVGTARVGKGALVFENVVRGLGAAGSHGVRWSVFGGGEPDLLRRLSRVPGVSIRGYYRAGTLPRLLRRHRVDVALLLSIVPESYGLTLSECWEAGVPVIAFDHGAIGERVRARGGGVLVPLAADWKGILGALSEVLNGRWPETVPAAATEPPPSARHAARAHLELYRELGFL
jgi:glycosyltransferase involved in cell wall biosynthesis